MAQNIKNVAQAAREAIADTVAELGYEIWDVEFVKEGASYYLRIYIDHENGIYIDDCEKVHRAIDPILDEVDPIEDFYYLEVSSPGIERELRTEEHILLTLGSLVEAKLFAPFEGRKSIVGILESFEDGKVTISEDGAPLTLPRASISKLATLYTEIDLDEE